MKLIDLHCDTIWKLMDLDRTGTLMENKGSISIPGMRRAGTAAQFFACFTYIEDYKEQGYEGAWKHVLEMIRFLEEQVRMFPQDIALACSREELKQNEAAGKISAFLTVEEGGVLNGKLERLEELYDRGVRLATLMWNYENCLGHPNSREASVMEKGLKPFGRQVVERMWELGMTVDVSHASDGTFWDILEMAKHHSERKGAVIASHSNCRALCAHPRNLSDEMIRRLADAGGVAGLNFYGPFLNTNGEMRLEDLASHVLHMIRAGGSSFPAIGTDFDGFDGVEVMEIKKADEMERLWDVLKKKGVSETQLDKLRYENALHSICG